MGRWHVMSTFHFHKGHRCSNPAKPCVERCCARRHRHLEVWPRLGSVSDTARRTSLARRPRSGVYQAGSDSSPVSERLRTAVPVGLLRSGRRCWHSAAPARYVLSGFVDDVMFSHNGPVGHKGDVMFGRVRQVLPPDGGRASSLC